MNKLKISFSLLILLLITLPLAHADVCAVYFSSLVCPHCVKASPIVYGDFINNSNNILVSYEVDPSNNIEVFNYYDEIYKIGSGVPVFLFSQDRVYIGDKPILDNIIKYSSSVSSNKCPLPEGMVDFSDLDFNKLLGKPIILSKDKVLFRISNETFDNSYLHMLFEDNFLESLSKMNYTKIKPINIEYIAGKELSYNNAIKLGGWVFEWNGNTSNEQNLPSVEINFKDNLLSFNTISKVISLALVDAVNPCEFAVLIMLLLSITLNNAGNRKKVLWSGLSFSLAIVLMYFIYGIIIVKAFQVAKTIALIRPIIYKVLGILALILGAFQIKDVINYRPGGFTTEMPLSWRPKVKALISKVTSPYGAFGVGTFVALFLIPCTMGPYIILGGILSAFEFLKVLPILLFYDLIFISPMIVITLIVYLGLSKVETLGEWKEKNIRWMHLIEGLILVILGLGMLLGIF